MEVKYYDQFLREFEKLDRSIRKKIQEKLEALRMLDRALFTPQPLKGSQFKGLFKFRVGDWRLIYKIVGKELHFITLGHRSDVYR